MLSRRVGESIQIGDDAIITLVSIGRGCVVLAVNTPHQSHTVGLAYEGRFTIGGAVVMLAQIDQGKVRLAFSAPREVRIYRTELLPIDEAKRP